MITPFVLIARLIVSYFMYGKYVDKVFGMKVERTTPAYTMGDGIGYVLMDKQRNSLIQLLYIESPSLSSDVEGDLFAFVFTLFAIGKTSNHTRTMIHHML